MLQLLVPVDEVVAGAVCFVLGIIIMFVGAGDSVPSRPTVGVEVPLCVLLLDAELVRGPRDVIKHP